jgi:LCP family protein required for cell wall assembly
VSNPTTPRKDETTEPVASGSTARGPMRSFLKRWRRWIIGVAILGAVVAITVPVARVWVAWNRIERVEFDPDAARTEIADQPLAIEGATTTTAVPVTEDPPTTAPIDPPAGVPFDGIIRNGDHTSVLIIGSDIGGFRADVIMLALIPNDGSNLALVSIPRDLYLDDPCRQGRRRINAALNGCGDVSGPNLLAIVVEDFTGVSVDHFVLFDFDGFARVIDAAGGVEICVNHYTFDNKTDPELALLAGCNEVNGSMALSWVRSRHTREVVGGVERTIPGVNDLARNARQREIVLQLLGRLSSFPSPAELVGLIEAVPGAFTLSESLNLTSAIGIAWDVRGTPVSSINSPEIPVQNYRNANGAQVLLPTESFSDTMGWIVP